MNSSGHPYVRTSTARCSLWEAEIRLSALSSLISESTSVITKSYPWPQTKEEISKIISFNPGLRLAYSASSLGVLNFIIYFPFGEVLTILFDQTDLFGTYNYLQIAY